MKRNAIISTVIVVLAIVAVVSLAVLNQPSAGDSADSTAAGPSDSGPETASVVRDDSHRLSTAPPGSPVFVEFLDFECEACRAAYPLIEQLREDYAGKVEFVFRYFPIDSHVNAMNAAKAVEAAARQGEVETMYRKMYETQASWGESRESKAALFRQFAQELGLDLSRYDADVAAPEVQARVEQDRKDGLKLGVQGTPTFFLDGQLIRPRSEQELRTLLDEAVGG